MSRIGRQFSANAYLQNSRSEGNEKGKGKSSNNTGSTGGSKKAGGGQKAGSLDDLPSVGLDSNVDNVDVVEQYMGGATTSYDDAVDQHNEIGAKAARGELLTQQDQGPANVNQNLRRQVDTLKARLEKLESQLNGVSQTSSTQGIQRTTARSRGVQTNRPGTSLRQSNLLTQEAAPIVEKKQATPMDDDLPRVGLIK